MTPAKERLTLPRISSQKRSSALPEAIMWLVPSAGPSLYTSMCHTSSRCRSCCSLPCLCTPTLPYAPCLASGLVVVVVVVVVAVLSTGSTVIALVVVVSPPVQ